MDAGKRKVYARQLEDESCHVAGIQEARSPKAGIYSVGPFIRVASAADHGNYGCELWLNSALPFARKSGKQLYVNQRHITILHSEPRALLVRVSALAINGLFA
eukprot:6850848-Karenia_brevis.AAC.1